MNVKANLRRKLWQIQLTCLGMLVSLAGCKYLIDYAIQNESLAGMTAASGCLFMLCMFLINLRKIVDTL